MWDSNNILVKIKAQNQLAHYRYLAATIPPSPEWETGLSQSLDAAMFWDGFDAAESASPLSDHYKSKSQIK